MGRLIALAAKTINGETPTKPRVVYVQEDLIKIVPTEKGDGLTKVIEKLLGETNIHLVYEKAMQVEAQRNPSSTDLLAKQHIAVSLTGAGTTQGAGTALTKYLNETTTIGAGATEAFVLPAATVGKVVCVFNNDAAGDAAKVFPATGEFINDQAVNTVYSIAANKCIFFVCPTTAGKWVVADDYGRP